MTEAATTEARDIALGEAKELEDLEKYSRASGWSDVPNEYIKDNCLDTDELEPSDIIGRWLNDDLMDIRVTFGLNSGCLHDVQVCTALNNPTTWVSYNGNADGILIIETSFSGDRWQTWARAPSVADYLWQLGETYRLARD